MFQFHPLPCKSAVKFTLFLGKSSQISPEIAAKLPNFKTANVGWKYFKKKNFWQSKWDQVDLEAAETCFFKNNLKDEMDTDKKSCTK